MTAPTLSHGRSAIPPTLVRFSVGLACAALAILVELGLDQVVAVAPWLIVTFTFGLVAAVLGGLLGGLAAAILGVAAQLAVIPALVPAVARLDGVGWPIDVGAAVAALLGGLWIRDLILHPRPVPIAGDAGTVAAAGAVTPVREGPAATGPGPQGTPPSPSGVRDRPPGEPVSSGVAVDRATAASPAEVEVVAVAVRELGVARTPAQVADALARHAAALAGASGAVVYLARDGTDGYAAVGRHGDTDPAAPERLPARTAAVGPAADGPGNTSASGADGNTGAGGVSGPDPTRRVVDWPIGSGSAPAGVLRLIGAANAPAPRIGPLVDVVVGVAAAALDRGRLQSARRVAEADAAGAVGRVAILARLAAALVAATTIEDVARTLVELAVDDLAAGFAVVHVPSDAAGGFAMAHSRGYPAGLVAGERTVPPAAVTPVSRAAADRAIVEVLGEDGWRAAFPAASNVPAITGVRAITAIPMQAGGEVQGVLTIGWRTAADRARADRDLLATAADQGAQALGRAILHAHDEDARRFQEAFIGVVSHELRTPITTLVAGSRLLRRRLDGDPRAVELSDDIVIEADRLSRIVDDLLVLSRLERRRLSIGDEPVHLDHLLTRVIRSEAAHWPEHPIVVRPSTGGHVVLGEETYVEQVLRNLISNAAKYSSAGSLVEIAVDDTPEGDVHVRVLDLGPGVEPAEVDRLFSLFYRSPSTAASATGAGIGLFVSRRLVAEMGGRMWARPRPGGGSEFGFSLACYPIDEGEAAAAPTRPATTADDRADAAGDRADAAGDPPPAGTTEA